jgi:DNA-binding NtrC family response regulator
LASRNDTPGEGRPDINLLMSDINMPGSMDGVKLAHVVRSRWPAVRVILATGRTRPEPMPPDTRFMAKPFRIDQVLAAVAELHRH